jgi:hypothetical protein
MRSGVADRQHLVLSGCAGINRHVGVSSEGWRIQWETAVCSQNSTTRRIRGLEKAMQQCYINVVIVRSSFCGGQVRFLFGMGEAGAFPIATRSLSRWMLPAERGFAQGITHAGSRLGAAFTPALVAFIIAGYG